MRGRIIAALLFVVACVAATTAPAASTSPIAETVALDARGAALGRAITGPALAASPGDLPPAAPSHRHHWLDPLVDAASSVSGTPSNASAVELPVAPSGARAFAATDPTSFRQTAVSGAPRNFIDEVDEPSVATNGTQVLFTYNFYDAISNDGGQTFRYVSPFSNFPSGTSSFCCDQRALYERSRNLFIWVLQYGDQDPGWERVAVATPQNVAFNKWTYWDFKASDFTGIDPGWMVDYPQVAASSNYLYLTMALGPITSASPSASAIVRISLDQLVQGTRPLTFQTYVSPLGNAIAPVQGATTTMYFGQNISSTQTNLYSWPESGQVDKATIAHTSVPSARGTACMSPGGKNVCGRIDGRIESGWLRGDVLGFTWSAGSGGPDARTYPYVQIMRVSATTRAIVEETQIFSALAAYVYPAAALNARGDIAVVATAVSPARQPSAVAFLRDDVSGPTQWTPMTLKNGTSGPLADEWGDYQTVTVASPTDNSWIAATYTVQATGVEPLYVSFGRERDAPGTSVQISPAPSPSGSPAPSSAASASPGASPTPLTTPGTSPSPAPTPGPNAPTTVYLPNVTKMLGGPDGWQTPFIVQNVGSISTDLTMSFYAFADGSLVKTRTVTGLAPGTSVFHDPNSDTDLAPGGQYSVVIRSSRAAIVAVVNEHQNVQSPTRQEALSYNGLGSGSNVMFLPYVAKNANGFLTTIIIQNLGTAPATVSARFLPASGTAVTVTRTVDAGRSQFIDPTVEPSLLGGAEYGATLTSTQPIGVVVNAHNDASSVPAPRGFSYNAIPATSDEETFLPYVARNSDAIQRTSRVYVLNAGTASVAPKLLLRKHGDGQNAGVGITGAPIAPGATWTFDPSTATQLSDGDWSLDVYGGKFAVIGAALSPATALGVSASSGFAQKLFLPNVTRTLGGPSGWTTPLIVQSTGAPFFTASWYRFSDGGLVLTQRYADLLPIEAVRIDPRSLPQLTDNTQYAVVLEAATGGIAAAVLEVNLGGGDAAMGYDGFASPGVAYGTSGCASPTVVSGTAETCVAFGLLPGAVPTVTLAITGSSPSPVTGPEAIAADGSWTFREIPFSQGQWNVTVAAGSVTQTLTFFVTAGTFTVTTVSSTYGSVSVRTAPGLVCQPQISLPTGSATSGFFLDQQTADTSGNVSWTYAQPAGTKSGQGTNRVRCYSGQEEHLVAPTFTVP